MKILKYIHKIKILMKQIKYQINYKQNLHYILKNYIRNIVKIKLIIFKKEIEKVLNNKNFNF